YSTSAPSEVAYILGDSGAVGLITEHAGADGPPLRHRLAFDGLDELAARGREYAEEHPDAVAAAAAAVEPDDLLTCIYPPGTTGPPKGCLLPNRNYFAMVGMLPGIPDFVRPGDRTVLFLPLAHSFGRLVHFGAARIGVTIAFCPDPNRLGAAMEDVHPH